MKHADTANNDKTATQKKIPYPLKREPQALKFCTCGPGRRIKTTKKKRACRPAFGRLAPPHGYRLGRVPGFLRRVCGLRGQARHETPNPQTCPPSALRALSRVRAQHKPLMLQWAVLSGCANCFIMRHYKTRRDSACGGRSSWRGYPDKARLPTCPAPYSWGGPAPASIFFLPQT